MSFINLDNYTELIPSEKNSIHVATCCNKTLIALIQLSAPENIINQPELKVSLPKKCIVNY